MDRLTVLTLNVWNRSGPWDTRRTLIRRGLEELRPDLVGLQEIVSDGETSNQAMELAEGLGYHVAYGAAATWAPGVTMGNAILSRWPIARSEAFILPAKGLARGADIEEARCLLHAQVASPWGELPFYCTHLAWRFHQGYAREAQAVAIAALVERTAPERGLPPILVGDFNAAPDAAEIRFLTGLQTLGYEQEEQQHAPRSTFFADAFAWAGEGEGATFDRRTNPFAAYAKEPPRRIDYVFVRGPDDVGRGEPTAARVVLDALHDGVAPSDHAGVYAEITVSR